MVSVLPDILRPGLRVVFCGTAAGTASARAGAYYAGPGNAFWATLHSTGLTPVRLSPAEFEQLPALGIGLTDICKVLHGSDQEVGTSEFDVTGLEARIAAVEPANLAFNGKNAAHGALMIQGEFGLEPVLLACALRETTRDRGGSTRSGVDPAGGRCGAADGRRRAA
jgi:TDG/mug DNA glycosylase family protein